MKRLADWGGSHCRRLAKRRIGEIMGVPVALVLALVASSSIVGCAQPVKTEIVVLSSGAMAKDCNGVAPEDWLVGAWEAGADTQTLVVRRDGARLVWTYDRKAGVTSDRWGAKVVASGSGTVDALDDCRAILRGHYTRFDGSGKTGQQTVGSPMEWKFLLTGPGVVASEGLGYGREAFHLRWRKSPGVSIENSIRSDSVMTASGQTAK